jgi:hypothetical protein
MSNPTQITERITAYACCSLSALHEYVQARIYGEDKCAEEKWGLYLYLRWAKTKMCDPCLSLKEKLDIAKKADCYCSPCGCPESPEEDCVIEAQLNVIDAIAFDELPPEPEEGDSYLIISGDNTGRIATWQGGADPQWVFVVVGVFNTVLAASGTYYINTGNGPGLLFPTVTAELTGGPSLWTLTLVNAFSTTQGRTVQLEGLGPNGWYAMWQGSENDLPLEVNLQGLPFTQVRMRYILANGCEYTSAGGTTIPDPPDSCGTIEYTLGEPEVLNGQWRVELTLSDAVAFPLGAVIFNIDGNPPAIGPQLVVGVNELGPFTLGQSVVITIVNSANPDCNIVLPEIVTECPTLEVETEAFLDCENQPEGPDGPTVPIWGTLVNITPNSNYPVGQVTYTTPSSPVVQQCVLLGSNQWGCGPLVVEENEGPMTITISNNLNKFCDVVLGPFEPGPCPPCEEADAEISQIFIEGVPTFQINYLSTDPVVVGQIQWTKNGTPQTPIVVNGVVAAYNLGPLDFGDVVTIALTDENREECVDDRGEFTVGLPSCPGLQILVIDETDAAIAVRGSSGFVTAISPSGTLTTYANADAGISLDELGVWCVYPSDSDGNASGTYLEMGIGFTGVDPVDFSPMDGSGPLSVLISNGFEVSGVLWTELTLPSLVGSNARLVLAGPLPNLTTANNPSGSKFANMDIQGAALTSASVDVLCNALDATATGQTSTFTGTAAATAASLANRNAYIANGNTLTFTA